MHGRKIGAASQGAAFPRLIDQPRPDQAGHVVRKGGAGNLQVFLNFADGQAVRPRLNQQTEGKKPVRIAQFGKLSGGKVCIHGA